MRFWPVFVCVCVGGGVSVTQHYDCQRLHVVTPGWLYTLCNWRKLTQTWNNMSMSMGYRQMVSLGSCQVCSPQMGLQPTESEPPFTAHRTRHKRKAAVWSLASWNVRSLVDVEGPVQTARQRKEVANAEERRIDQVVSELNRYKIDVAALQETKWFRDAAYRFGANSGKENSRFW